MNIGEGEKGVKDESLIQGTEFWVVDDVTDGAVEDWDEQVRGEENQKLF